MAEIDLGIPGRQCLSQRIDNIADLRRQVKAWEKGRYGAKVKVNWQFTITDAGMKLKELYPSREK